MLLQTAAIFVGLGIALFIIGLAFERPEIALFGAIIVIGVGGTGVVQGYQVAVGEDVTTESVDTEVPEEDISEWTLLHEKDVSGNSGEPTGIEFRPSGTVIYVSDAQNSQIDQFSTTDYDLSLATHERSFDVSGETGDPQDVLLNDTGARMWVFGGSGTVYQYDLGDPWNVTTASLNGSVDVSADVGTLGGGHVSADHLELADEANGDIVTYDMSDKYNVSSATYHETYDVSSQDTAPTDLAYNANGTRMILTGDDTDSLYEYELGEPFSIHSASYTGGSLDVSSETLTPAGTAFEHGELEAFLVDQKGAMRYEYDASATATVDTTKKATQYEDVEAISSFPLELVVLLVGAVMLMSGAGEASETDKANPPRGRRGR